MYYNVNRVDYFYTTVKDQPGEAYKLLSALADLGVNLFAFNAVPLGSAGAQLSLFPQDSELLTSIAKKSGIKLEGPNPALLIQGDDDIGVLAEIHQKLFNANINVYSAIGVTTGKGTFGYLVYLRPDEYDRALSALGM
jgi:predicted amino acid-binding ACT domain protein